VEFRLVRDLKAHGFPGSDHWSLDSRQPLPDLGLLIRACGNGFGKLRRDKRDQWTATGKKAVEVAATPEDAVGALWLLLEANRNGRDKKDKST
jgi:hypothetical protein